MHQFTKTASSRLQPSLPMGWALKSSATKRFSQKQKDYLSIQFRIGERTGQKVNAATVAKDMMSARDTEGNRLFTNEEFLTSKQIAGFFSRMASKKTLPDEISDLDIEQHSVDKEKAFSELSNQVMDDYANTLKIQPCQNLLFRC